MIRAYDFVMPGDSIIKELNSLEAKGHQERQGEGFYT
jgi:hypothetical protein